jgi:minor extracellular serine protease Vpr
MRKLIMLVLLLCIGNVLFPQSKSGSGNQYLKIITNEAGNKILSGKLFEKISELQNEPGNSLKNTGGKNLSVILYFSEYPSAEQIQTLENLNVKCFWETWTPPLENHKYGFLIASVPVENLPDILDLPLIKKMDTAERSNTVLNNTAIQSIKALMVWEKGITGKGVKIGILDSGVDFTYEGTDLPSSFQYKDYSDYPYLDETVANAVTGHGTHVAATALGRGVLSDGQTHLNNGKGAFKGTAPDADLVFLKIGNDTNAIATDESVIAAIDAAVNNYHVDILSMSYGGWNDYHDGSSALEQKVDWAFEKGVPFFCSAGNSAEDDKHFSGVLAANSESDFIEVKVSGAGINDTKLRFNMVWSDGSNRNDLTLQYYNSAKEPLNEVTVLPITESLRGIESQYSYRDSFLPSGNGTYFLKVINNSPNTQEFHIYEDWSNLIEGTDHVYFSMADPNYTIGSPSSADHALAVGAYVSKTVWSDYNDNSWWWGPQYIYNNIAEYSSNGPTMDGRIKPDICAPGHVLISLRDKDVYGTPNKNWIDNDGIVGGDANYFQMHGTSMACPVAAGAAALYLEKYPDATPDQVYEAFLNNSNQSGLSDLPNNIWGSGKLDIYSAIQGKCDEIIIDGNMDDEKYEILAEYSSGRNGYGDKNNLGAIKYYTDGEYFYIGITGEVTGNDNIALFMDFSGVQGRGNDYLGGGNSGEFVNCVFSYMGNVKLDFDADFALGFNEGSSTQYEFFTDAIRFGTSNFCSNIGKTNQMGASSTYNIGSVFGGSGYITIAYDSGFSANPGKGVEVKIPVSAFAGVDTSQTLRLFALIASMAGDVSNECIPGDPGADNLGDGADLSAIDEQDFFTEPVKISAPEITGIELINDEQRLISLDQNYPNPFDAVTTIGFSVSKAAFTTLKIYNDLGLPVETLVDQYLAEGHYRVNWDGSNFPGGMYFYQIQSDKFSISKKFILLK